MEGNFENSGRETWKKEKLDESKREMELSSLLICHPCLNETLWLLLRHLTATAEPCGLSNPAI
jgi:hypothetical protein